MYITVQEVKERIDTLLGADSTYLFFGHTYLPFSKHTKNVEIIEGFQLHEFLCKDKDDTASRINIKLLADVHNIRLEYGADFGIGDVLVKERQKFLKPKEGKMYETYHRQGNAADIHCLSHHYSEVRELRKATRIVKRKNGGGALIFDDYIHLDSMLNRCVDKTNRRR